MMLRSSSTPVLGSLLSPFSDSPNRDFENSCSNNSKQPSNSDHHIPKKISFCHGGQPHFSSFSCNSSPISHFVVGCSDFDPESISARSRGFRRARSDGNLESLAATSCNIDDFYTTKPLTRSSRRSSMSVLETIPSFSINDSRDGYEDEDEFQQEEREEEELGERDESLKRSVTIGDNITAVGSGEEEVLGERDGSMKRSAKIGDSIMAVGSGEFSFEKNKNLGLIVEEEISSDVEEEKGSMSPPLYLARGIGIDVGGLGGGAGGGGGGGISDGFSLDGFGEGSSPEGSQIEEYYKRMVEENPCNPLFLSNYAQFLYQSKKDMQGAEEYYSRSILIDPTDGEIMLQYAKLLWEVYHDDRASSYFERAVQAAPGDSHVLAAYASFLWDTEDKEEGSLSQDLGDAPAYHVGAVASAIA